MGGFFCYDQRRFIIPKKFQQVFTSGKLIIQ